MCCIKETYTDILCTYHDDDDVDADDLLYTTIYIYISLL